MTKIARDADALPFGHALDLHQGPLLRDRDYDLCHFDALVQTDADAGSSRFTECAFENVVFEGVRLRRAKFTDVWWRGGRVLSGDLAESEWLDAGVLSCAFAGVEAFGAQLRRVVFQRCKLDAVNLRGAELHEVVFEDCILRDVDFSGASLRDVSFRGSAVRDGKFAKSKLTRADFRDATVLECVDGFENLKGAIIDSSQAIELAMEFAQALRITVKDD
ncbi:pentapeptide repeat-containing protein [Actinospica durhamensis]|uniref:Pentapeptide repeat-containing protein n=1 Tax=Actinospica durhamensis TaxID=1508375 RepID=A0A941ESH4_9ACTN|nr:pentapeptide repeat-containing protein [Actinospica durhamensis]MBR7836506.1 pentapeptide repeat-containing protein [Actinospica durhamensis]